MGKGKDLATAEKQKLKLLRSNVHNEGTLKELYWNRRTIKAAIENIPDLAPCDFCSSPKLRGCHYETIEKMKEAMTKVIDTLTQENFHGAFQKFLER